MRAAAAGVRGERTTQRRSVRSWTKATSNSCSGALGTSCTPTGSMPGRVEARAARANGVRSTGPTVCGHARCAWDAPRRARSSRTACPLPGRDRPRGVAYSGRMPWPTHSTGLLRGGVGLARHAERRADPHLLAELAADPRTRALRIRGDRTDVVEDGAHIRLDLSPVGPGEEPLAYLGDRADGTSVVLVAGPAEDERGGSTLRGVGALLDDADGSLVATGLGLANWHAAHTHCPRCGTPTEVHSAGWSRRCPADESLHFPRTDPAVIMAVVDDADRLLLARGRGFASTGIRSSPASWSRGSPSRRPSPARSRRRSASASRTSSTSATSRGPSRPRSWSASSRTPGTAPAHAGGRDRGGSVVHP